VNRERPRDLQASLSHGIFGWNRWLLAASAAGSCQVFFIQPKVGSTCRPGHRSWDAVRGRIVELRRPPSAPAAQFDSLAAPRAGRSHVEGRGSGVGLY